MTYLYLKAKVEKAAAEATEKEAKEREEAKAKEEAPDTIHCHNTSHNNN